MFQRNRILKIERKIYHPRFNSAKISNKLSYKMNSFSGSTSAYSNTSTRNKNTILITSVLSTSKHYIINGNEGEYRLNDIGNIRYEYPYKPDVFTKINNEFIEKNILLSEKINLLFRNNNVGNISSAESNKSTFKSSSYKTSAKNRVLKSNNFSLSSIGKKKLYLVSPKQKAIKITKRMLPESKNIPKYKNNTDIIKDNFIQISQEIFLDYIDKINADKSYINRCKIKLSEYFNNKYNKNDLYLLKDLFNNLKIGEENKDNYFSSDFLSTKKINLNIKDLNILLKLSSLKLIFYEIKYEKENKKTNNYFNSFNNEKHIFNSKIKFPFEFLSVFYGLNFNYFINLLLALVEFNFSTNKFYIDYNNFKDKIEESKILYDFFNEKCFANVYNMNNAKEYFLFNWDVKINNNETKHYCLKMILPKMQIKVKCGDKIKIKFYSYVSIQTMKHLLKNEFNYWDIFILIYFSEHKIFRYEINKIICGKYSSEEYHMNSNQFTQGQKMNFNLTNNTIKLNTLKKSNKSYSFFFSYLKEEKLETYFINFTLPQIVISYKSFNKKFELDFKKLFQLNKLRKYFRSEDLIKYSLTVKLFKKANKRELEKKMMKKLLSSNTTKPEPRTSSRLSIEKNKKSNFRQFFKNKLKKEKEKEMANIIPQMPEEEYEEVITDIDLNLDKYIFNFDETLFKFIDINDIHKNDPKDNSKNDMNGNAFQVNNNKKRMTINIGTLSLSWTNRAGLTNEYKFDTKISHFLFDLPIIKWRLYVENNIEGIIKGIPNVKRNEQNKKTFFYQKRKNQF